MSRAYDILVVDLDGTLLNSRREVSSRNREVLDEARAAGMELVIATGRTFSESRVYLDDIGHDAAVVAAGGSMLCDAATGVTLHRSVIPNTVVGEVVAAVIEFGQKALILKDAHVAGYDYMIVGPGELSAASQWWFESLEVEVRFAASIDDDDHPHDTVRAGVVNDGATIAPIAESIRQRVAERAHVQHWSAVTATEAIGASTHLLEVFGYGVDKWTMIERLCVERRIDPQRVAAIGDEINDIKTLENAGLGVAMGNAAAAVKDVADHTTGHYDEDGFARAVERIVTGVW